MKVFICFVSMRWVSSRSSFAVSLNEISLAPKHHGRRAGLTCPLSVFEGVMLIWSLMKVQKQYAKVVAW